MSEFDLHTIIDDRVALDNQEITTNTTTVGEIIDTKGFESLEFITHSGTLTDGAYAILLEEGDESDLADATVLPAADTLGALTGFALTDDDITIRVGSIGKKRFQRLSLVSTSVTTGGFFSGIAVLGTPHSGPVAQ